MAKAQKRSRSKVRGNNKLRANKEKRPVESDGWRVENDKLMAVQQCNSEQGSRGQWMLGLVDCLPCAAQGSHERDLRQDTPAADWLRAAGHGMVIIVSRYLLYLRYSTPVGHTATRHLTMALRQSATRSLRVASRNVAPSARAFSVSALRQKELASDVSDLPNLRVRRHTYDPSACCELEY